MIPAQIARSARLSRTCGTRASPRRDRRRVEATRKEVSTDAQHLPSRPAVPGSRPTGGNTVLLVDGLNGLEVLKALRQIDPKLPAILASGYDQAHALSSAPGDRPDVFLNKPFGLDQLRDALGRSLRNG